MGAVGRNASVGEAVRQVREQNVNFALYPKMGRAGIEPATHGFSVPEKPRFSPQKRTFLEPRYTEIHWRTMRTCVGHRNARANACAL